MDKDDTTVSDTNTIDRIYRKVIIHMHIMHIVVNFSISQNNRSCHVFAVEPALPTVILKIIIPFGDVSPAACALKIQFSIFQKNATSCLVALHVFDHDMVLFVHL